MSSKNVFILSDGFHKLDTSTVKINPKNFLNRTITIINLNYSNSLRSLCVKCQERLPKTNTLVILLTTILFGRTVGVSSTTTAFLRESSPVAERDHFKPEPRIVGGQYVAEPGFYSFHCEY